MNLYKKLGLIDEIEIKLDANLKTIVNALQSFKASDKNRFLNQFSSTFTPSGLTIGNQNFKLSKEPRIFNPVTSVGEIDAELFEDGEITLIKATIRSFYNFLNFMVIFGFFLLLLMILLTPNMNLFEVLLWFVLYQTIPTIFYFILRYHVKRLKLEFSNFMLKICKP